MNVTGVFAVLIVPIEIFLVTIRISNHFSHILYDSKNEEIVQFFIFVEELFRRFHVKTIVFRAGFGVAGYSGIRVNLIGTAGSRGQSVEIISEMGKLVTLRKPWDRLLKRYFGWDFRSKKLEEKSEMTGN